MTARPDIFNKAGWRITSPYGERIHPIRRVKSRHRGVDLVKSHRAPIPAFTSGVVRFAGDGTGHRGFGAAQGIAVAIEDRHGYLHCYLHLARVMVRVGREVAQGDIIGLQGNTGTLTTGSHLHYEVRLSTTPSWGWDSDVDPGMYLASWTEVEPVKPDAPSDWAVEAQEWVRAQGISDGRRPRDTVTREETWVMLHRLARQRPQDGL